MIGILYNFVLISRHGRLRERDQLLAIDGQPLDISHQEAIKILQSAGGLVEIVVARGPVPQAAVAPGDQQDIHDQQAGQQVNSEVSDMVCLYYFKIAVYEMLHLKYSSFIFLS